MNRAFLIILVPTAVVAVGYVFVLKAMGMEPGYWRLAGVVAALGFGFWLIGKRAKSVRS
jgi:ABC-type spermidine/putrescine transport system permease subunit II